MHFVKTHGKKEKIYLYIYMQRLIITIIIDLYTIDKFFLKNHLTKTLFTSKEG